VLVAQLAPHADLSSDHVHILYPRFEGIHRTPVGVVSVRHTVPVPYALVQIKKIAAGKNYFVFAAN